LQWARAHGCDWDEWTAGTEPDYLRTPVHMCHRCPPPPCSMPPILSAAPLSASPDHFPTQSKAGNNTEVTALADVCFSR